MGETRLLRTGIVRVLQSTECPRSVCGEGAGEEEEARGLCGMNCAREGVLTVQAGQGQNRVYEQK